MGPDSQGPERGGSVSEVPACLSTVSIEDVGSTESPACVFECAGTPAAAQLAVQILRPLGGLLLVGLSLAPLDLAAPPIVIKELSIRGVIAYRRAQFQAAIDMLAAGAIPVGDLITDVVPLEEAEAAFQSLTARGSEKVKVLLAPSWMRPAVAGRVPRSPAPPRGQLMTSVTDALISSQSTATPRPGPVGAWMSPWESMIGKPARP